MPLYTISIQDCTLSPEEKSALAAEISDFHCGMTGLDKAYAKIIFTTFAPGEGFVGGEAAAAVTLTVPIREGRSSDDKRNMLLKLWAVLRSATAATDAQMMVVIREVPESDAMEMGQIVPES